MKGFAMNDEKAMKVIKETGGSATNERNQTVEGTCYLNKYTGETLPVKAIKSHGSALSLKGEIVWSNQAATLFDAEKMCLPEIDKAIGVLYQKGIFPDLVMIEARIILRSKALRADRLSAPVQIPVWTELKCSDCDTTTKGFVTVNWPIVTQSQMEEVKNGESRMEDQDGNEIFARPKRIEL
jgi:hypothetical protein